MLTMGRRSRSRVFDSRAGLRREVVVALGSLLYAALLVAGLTLPAVAAGVDHTCGSTIFAYDGPVDVEQGCAVERVGSAVPIVRVEGAAVLAERSSGHAHDRSASFVAPRTTRVYSSGADALEGGAISLDDAVRVASENGIDMRAIGESGFYRPIAESTLSEASMPYWVVFSGPSSASVISAVEAGVGVALVSGSTSLWANRQRWRPN